MTIITNNAEGGSNTVAMTQGSGGNTGGVSGDFLNTITGTWAFSTTGAAHGTLGMRVNQSSAAAWRAYWTFTGTSTVSVRQYFCLNSLPSAVRILGVSVNATFGTNALGYGVDSVNKPILQSAGATRATGAAALTAATSYRFEGYVTIGGSTTTANGAMQICAGDSATTLVTYSALANNFTAGHTDSIVRWQMGNNNNETVDVTYDDLKIDTGNGSSFLGAYGTGSAAPVISQPSRIQMSGPGSQLLSFVATASGGDTNDSGAITWVSGPLPSSVAGPTLTGSTSGLNTQTTTFSATPTLLAGRYVFAANSHAVAGGNAAQKTFIVDVPAATSAAVAVESVTAAAYVNQGGAASLVAAVNDGNAATYPESPAAPAGQVLRSVWEPFPLGSITFNCENYQNPGSPPITVQATVFKEDGTTQLYQMSFTAPTADAVTAINPDASALALIPALTDRRALVVDFAPTQ